MELKILYIIYVIISFVCIVVQRKHNKWLFDKLKSKTSENERHTPIDTSSLKKSCEDKIVGNKITWDTPYSKYRYKYKKIAENIYNEFNYNFEALNKKEENNKMNKKQLISENIQLHKTVTDYRSEITRLENELRDERIKNDELRNEYKNSEREYEAIIIATQEEMEHAKCCRTCEAFNIGIFGRSSCKNKIITSYEDIDTEETKCKEYSPKFNVLANKVIEIQKNKEHTESVKKAKPKIVKIDKGEK